MAGRADSAPCAHAPAPASYKAASLARPDKVLASCDVTTRSRGFPGEQTRQPVKDTTWTLGPAGLQPRCGVTFTLGAASRA